jgi:chromosomal replication initiator protein
MQKCRPLTFSRLVGVPEIRPALNAVRHLCDLITSRRPAPMAIPLFLHGPSGTGKTHLVSALVEEVIQRAPRSIVSVVSAKDLTEPAILPEMDPLDEADGIRHWRSSDLVVIEDVHQLGPRSEELLARVIDDLQGRQVPVVLTALYSPRELEVSFRLSSRLSAGLVVELQPMGVPSRLAVLQQKAQERQLAVGAEILDWLAKHLKGSGRELEGAIARLELLSRHGHLDVPTLTSHFGEEAKATRPSIEQIVQRVSRHFRIPRAELSSTTRNRHVVLPRQLSMYLTRQLTDLSLQEIGSHFGGRDHSTVLYACRKVIAALKQDAVLAGTVQQLQAELR